MERIPNHGIVINTAIVINITQHKPLRLFLFLSMIMTLTVTSSKHILRKKVLMSLTLAQILHHDATQSTTTPYLNYTYTHQIAFTIVNYKIYCRFLYHLILIIPKHQFHHALTKDITRILIIHQFLWMKKLKTFALNNVVVLIRHLFINLVAMLLMEI